MPALIPQTDTTPIGIVKSIDRQRAARPDCVVELMPSQSDAIRALLMREVEAQAWREAELAKARELAQAAT